MATRKRKPTGNLKRVSQLIAMAEETLSPEEAFLGDLERSIELYEKQNAHIPSQFYKPSSMGCIRNMYYQRIGAEETDSFETYTGIGICNSGSDTHVRIQTYVSHMKELGFDCEYVNVANYVKEHKLKDIKIISQQGMETKLFNKKLNLSFLCDGIIKYCGQYYILELKTESVNKWIRRFSVDSSHYHQAICYSISLDIPQVLFVYINRDMLEMKSFMFEPTDDMKQDVIGLLDNCESYVKKKTCPPKPENVDKKTCGYCHYKKLCKKEV